MEVVNSMMKFLNLSLRVTDRKSAGIFWYLDDGKNDFRSSGLPLLQHFGRIESGRVIPQQTLEDFLVCDSEITWSYLTCAQE